MVFWGSRNAFGFGKFDDRNVLSLPEMVKIKSASYRFLFGAIFKEPIQDMHIVPYAISRTLVYLMNLESPGHTSDAKSFLRKRSPHSARGH